ncbi:putative sodium-coupled neutral amino acid transporter 8a [Pangasianodon hypophthalmus]|uniref:putative sodium-coupled neutral amino acid transporter 8a n=1 Tax=Pangasianodon hypophthalmus TaxID=310915 RepID=UPI000EFDF10B|nr:putative sodium-coupled neutral amino acid transporter 8a [Pangasianodon hypophthalmus]
MEAQTGGDAGVFDKPRMSTSSPSPRLGFCGAVFIMLKSALGAGLLSFPWAFSRAGGVHTAVTVEMFSLVFLVSGLVILGYSSSISGQSTYQAVVGHLCGPAIGKLCELCFVLNVFMICVAFLVILADQLKKLSISIYELITDSAGNAMPYHWYTDQRFTLFLVCLFVILPLSIPKEIWIQKYTSALGTVAATYLTVAIVVRYYTRTVPEVHLSPSYNTGMGFWASIFNVIPTICFGFQCHECCVAVYSSLGNKKLSNWVIISLLSMFICLVIYTLTGIYGYLTFGRNVAADVLMSYSGDDVLMIIARLLFGVSIITIYPIALLLGRLVIQDPLLRHRETESYETCIRVALTAVWIIITLLIALFVPDISKVISIIGGISAFFIFVFPGLCLIFAMQSQPMSARLRWILIAWGMITILFGTFIFGQSTFFAIMQVFHKL